MRRRIAVLAALALLASGLLVTGGSVASPASAKRYTPPAGVKVTHPLGSRADRRAVLNHLIRSVNAVPRRGTIRVASWNVRSDAFVDALVRAHDKRKVSVRVILDRANANKKNPNLGINRLKRELRKHGNKSRRAERRSGVRKCVRSCRGGSGIAHSKFFLFDRAGKARWVIVNSSANATDLAASHQWNDSYTVRGREKVYRKFENVFDQMWRDRPMRNPYRTTRIGDDRVLFFPYVGRRTPGDPVLRLLNPVRCKGARNTGGRTKIRVAMTSWHGKRGKRIAWRIRQLKNQGCQVRIVYAVAGNDVLRILRREGPRPVPMRQIVQDNNGDRVYDRYLHTKVLTVRGRYGSDRRAWLTVNGSENWSPAAIPSDEVVFRIWRRGVLRRYNRYIDGLYRNPPHNPHPYSGGTSGEARMQTSSGLPEHLPLGSRVDGVDPYRDIEVN